MRREYRMIPGWVFVLAAITVLGGSSVSAGGRDEGETMTLPSTLVTALKVPRTLDRTMIRTDWASMREYPPVRLLLDDDGPDLLIKVPILDQLASLLKDFPELDSLMISEIWMTGNGNKTWIKIQGSTGDFEDGLLQGGWWRPAETEGILAEPLEGILAENLAAIRADPDGFPHTTPEEYERMAASRVRRVAWTGENWLTIVGPGVLIHDPLHCNEVSLTEFPEELGFPNGLLLGPLEGAMMVIALDLKENDSPDPTVAEAGTPGSEMTIFQLRREIRRLEKAPETVVMSEIGDSFFRVAETDGGLVIDLESRMPDDRGPGAGSVEVFRMMTQLAAVGISWIAPALAQELFAAEFRADSAAVRGSVRFSLASMVDAANAWRRHMRRLGELQARLFELETGGEDAQ